MFEMVSEIVAKWCRKHLKDAAIRFDVPSPFGHLRVEQSAEAVVAIDWGSRVITGTRGDENALSHEVKRQLAAYFAGTLRRFDLPLKPKGDAFQQAVCRSMLAIPYGETTTYGAIAKALDTMPQPVGNACGGNSIPIIIPCHRVLAANGLGGYSGDGGVERKIALLKHEGGYPFLF